MKRLFIGIAVFVFCVYTIGCRISGKKGASEIISSIQEGFVSPPESARPWVYWFWVNSNLTREGITADLEAMKRVGIGGVLIMDVGQGAPPGSIKYMDGQWQEMAQFAIKEAARLGLQISMNNSAGWSGSGGPWVEPEYAMQLVVFTETTVTGGSKVETDVPQPPATGGYYRDIAVMAVKDPALRSVRMEDANPFLNIQTHRKEVKAGLPTREKPIVLTIPDKDSIVSMDIRFKSPFTACALDLETPSLPGSVKVNLEVSDDGRVFNTIKTFDLRRGKNFIVFDKVDARWFRVKLKKRSAEPEEILISKFEVHNRFHPDNLEMKLWNTYYEYGKEFHGIYLYSFQSAPVEAKAPEGVVVARENVIDISEYMDAEGRLRWDAPPGQWTILRFGHTYSRAINPPSAEGGEGPECDKLSKEGIRRHFSDGMMKKLTELAGTDVGKTLTTFHIDSWEVNGQNWTREMRDEFRKRRGYDIVPFLPVFSGRVIGSLQLTERFMWDVRKTVSELIVENYVGEMQKICHENNMQFSFECYTTPANDLDAANYVDVPIAEVWSGGGFSATTKSMSSAAHINGRTVVGAEVFTSGWDEKWQMHPASVKASGDQAFCKGINKFIFHRYAMQPYLNIKPGLAMGPWGLHYERTQTWWEYTLPWHTYIARCQYLLQQGVFVADVLNLQPEEPGYWFEELPLSGYDYNACSPDAFMKVKVEDGELVDGAGNRYKLLVLTHLGSMTVQLLTHVRDLVVQGASVLGDPPNATPGLGGYPDSDEQLKKLVEELWGAEEETGATTVRNVGKGRVFTGFKPEEALDKIGTLPDFETDTELNYIHRKTDEMDIFFVANGSDSAVTSNCTFRITGKVPQWWDPETGKMTNLSVYTPTKENRITLPLTLGPSGSGFLIFLPAGDETLNQVTDIVRDDQTLIRDGVATDAFKMAANGQWIPDIINGETSLPGKYIITRENGARDTVNISPGHLKISGPWDLKFPEEGGNHELVLDTLASWTELPQKDLHYFSGTASYTKKISIPASAMNEADRLILDLGKVEIMAKVFVNGKEAGICWRPPYQVDITGLVHEGKNTLQIDVVNLWVNRLIGDEHLPEDSKRVPFTLYGKLPYENGLLGEWPDWVLKGEESPTGRKTFTTWRLWNKEDPLQESGLFGPVTIMGLKSLRY